MKKRARFIRLISLAAACVPATSLAATTVFDAEAALADMRRAIATPETVVDFCIRQYPAQGERLRAAFGAWRRNNADVIFEVETRADKLLRKKSVGDTSEYAKLVDRDAAALAQYRAAYAASLRRMPAAESEPACANYGNDLVHGGVNVSDLEKMFAGELATLRSQDGASRR